MKTYVRIAALLGLLGFFLWATYAAGRNWFLYATLYGGSAGLTRIDSNQSTLGHLETQWYWAMVVCAVLALGCITLLVLRLVRWMRGGKQDDDDAE